MGRELKRVPAGFDWPIDKVWKGYVNPHYEKCSVCDGSGDTVAAKRLSAIVAHLLLSGTDATSGKAHPYFNGREISWHGSEGVACGPDMAELAIGLAGRTPSFFGHDACDRWTATKKILAAAGMPETWGTCAACDGHGIIKEKYAAYEAWEREEPPTGEAYQIWETVSEGSPISPAFLTPEELARHMATTRWGADKGTDYETWLKFINGPGWAPSMISDANGVHDGVSASV